MKLSHWGRVIGPVGLVLLLASVLTYFLAGDTWLAFVNIALGLLGLAFYFATNFRELNQFASGKGSFFMVTSAVTAVVLVAGLVAANYLAVKHPRSWDVTANKIHTLSSDTLQTLAGLKEPIKVVAFYQPGERAYPAFDALFMKYKSVSDKFTYEYINPLKDPVAVKKYNIKESGARVVVEVGKLQQRVTQPTEEELTNAIVKATHSAKKKVYFVTGHGEAGLDDRTGDGLSALAARMADEGLESASLSLLTTPEIPRDAEVVIVAGPQKPLVANEVAILQKYVSQGGKLMVMVEPMIQSGLDPLLRTYGLSVDSGMVVDVNAQKLFQTSPFMPVVLQYGDTEITRGFNIQTAFPTAASLTLGNAADVNVKPMLLTLKNSWVETQPDQKPIQHDPSEKLGPLTLGAVATKDTSKTEASLKRGDQARVVVIGDKDFLTNNALPTAGNEDLALNCLSWLSSQVDRISIRPRERDASRIYLTSAQMGGIRFFATELPVALLAFGLAIFFNRRAR